MANVLQNILSQVSSDRMMALSAASYMEKRVEKAANLTTALGSVLSEEEDASIALEHDLPSNVLITDIDGNYKQVLTSSLLSACEQGDDKFISGGSTFDVDTIVDEISSAVAGGYAAAEALRTIAYGYQNNNDTTSLISDFRSRMELRFSGLTSAAASYGYLFLDVISANSMSIVDKIKSIMSLLGVSSAMTYNGIGKPQSSFKDVTGVNVWTAFAADVAEADVINTVVKAGQKIWDGLGKIANSVFGSIAKKVTKTVKVYTAVLDSFKSDDEGEFNGFSDYGTTLKLTNAAFANPYDTTTILNASKHYGALILNDDSYVPEATDIVGIFNEYLTGITLSSTITECIDALYSELNAPVSISGRRSNSILNDLQLIEDYAYGHLFPNKAFFDKLSSTHYLVFETIGADVYSWIDGSDVYIQFNWKPISINYQDYDWVGLAAGTSDWEPVIATIKNSAVNPATDAEMIKFVEYSKRWNAIYMTYLARIMGHVMTGNPQNDAIFMYNNIGVYPSYSGDYSSEDPYDNLRLSRFLSGSSDGSFILKDLSVSNALTDGMLSLFETMTTGEYYAAYYYSPVMLKGRYEVITDTQLSNMVTYLIIGVGAIIVGVYAIKAFTALGSKAFAMKAKAESGAWALASAGTGTSADYAKLYKLSRKANRLSIIASALTGSVSTLFTIGSSSSALLNSNGILGVGNNIKGGKSINDVYSIIK